MDVGDKLVIILSDDREQALRIKKRIKDLAENADVFVTDNTEVAYRVIQRKRVSLLIADMGDGKVDMDTNPVEKMVSQLRTQEMFLFLPIILLCATDEYRMRAYCEWNSVGYYKWPFDVECLLEKVEYILSAEVPDENDNSFIIRRHNVRYLVRVRELMYVRFFDRTLHLYMNNGEELLVEQRPVQMIVKLANARCMLQCSRGVLVNMMYVDKIQFRKREIRLRDGNRLKIGETYEKQIKDAWGEIDLLIKQNEEEMNTYNIN